MRKVLSVAVTVITLALIVGVCALMCVHSCHHHHDDEVGDDIIMTEPMKHRPHTQEHSGLACCPCGGCHAKKEDDDHYGDNIDVSIIIKILSVFTMLATLLSALHI